MNHPEIDENKLKQKENQFTKLNDRRQEIKAGIKDKKNQKSKLKTILEMVNEELLPVCVDIADEIKENRYEQLFVSSDCFTQREIFISNIAFCALSFLNLNLNFVVICL